MEENNIPEGYYVPIHRSLTEKMLMAGAPRDFVFANGILGFAIGVISGAYPVLLVSIFAHIIAVAFTKKDPQFFDCVKMHIKEKNYYGV